jgi:NTP pyrophosphatase (non-canonical NTP hydrolase)
MLTFRQLSEVNLQRANRWHKGGLDEWTPSDWACAAAGEMGEVCNAIKKYNRIVQHIASNNNPVDLRDALQKIATEIGDTIVYLDLLAQRMGIDTGLAVRETFNRISDRENMPERL